MDTGRGRRGSRAAGRQKLEMFNITIVRNLNIMHQTVRVNPRNKMSNPTM